MKSYASATCVVIMQLSVIEGGCGAPSLLRWGFVHFLFLCLRYCSVFLFRCAFHDVITRIIQTVYLVCVSSSQLDEIVFITVVTA